MAWSMVKPLSWNILAWFAWGVMILALRFHLERQRQKSAIQEALVAPTEP
jgi:heme exporter protein C